MTTIGIFQTSAYSVGKSMSDDVMSPVTAESQGAEPEPITAADLLPADLLDGDEIVILAIKPSLWFIVFESFRWLMATVVLILLAGWIGRHIAFVNTAMVVQGALVLSAARLGIALLQWASRLYVLTNRRVMRLMGMVNIDLFECPLTKLQNTNLSLMWYERLTGLGTISFATAGTAGFEASWRTVNQPLELHEQIRTAIRRAQRPPKGL